MEAVAMRKQLYDNYYYAYQHWQNVEMQVIINYDHILHFSLHIWLYVINFTNILGYLGYVWP